MPLYQGMYSQNNMTKDEAQKKIGELVERFGEQIDSYKKSDYNETLTRRDFIDPFFKALGWDIDNEQGYAEAYREVIHEDRVKVGTATKAPDYSFRLVGGKKLFFVEAKKPSVVVKDDILPAYQIRRYGWSAKLPISIITDFEEFAIYDCTKRPNPTDKASVARIKYLTYKDYINEFDFLWDAFSKERVLKGSFDKFVQGNANKKGTATVDKEFLQSLDSWRTYLATSISSNNKNLDEDEINFVVQQTIDRIIFLRIAEARSIEPYGNLMTALKGDYYQNLFKLFKEADQKYNSGLFDFKKDKYSEKLKVDNKVIKNIISELYYPESPYEFSVLPVEILGSAYEQFLGKVIRLTPSHQAKIEEKPEVRKAGGVYYTPQYIVEYIVQNTVGKLTEGKTPKEISKLKIVDPACGSGSFLIGAYQYLLDYHKNYYSENGKPSKGKKSDLLTPEGNLTTSEKKRILLNNIFGVDLDTNAVEVTKLSLLLKCMEGETQASISHQLKLINERVLPTLDNNIKSGNSLIDLDFYDGQLDFGGEKKIKPFNWQRAFPEVFNIEVKQEVDIRNLLQEPEIKYGDFGGFDCVIGNPPYVRQELLADFKDYFHRKYKVYHGTADLYSYFFERGISLLREGGLFGIIVANKWMRANYGEPLRKWLNDQHIKEIIDFGDLPVFESATTYPCIFISTKSKKPATSLEVTTVKFLPPLPSLHFLNEYVAEHQQLLSKSLLQSDGWNLAGEAEHSLLKKLQVKGMPLSEYVKGKIYRGVLTGLNEAFVINGETKRKLIKEDKKSAEIIKPFLAGKDVKRYQEPRSDKFLLFTRRGIEIDKYPAVKEYLLQFKTQLQPKPKDYKGKTWKGRKPGSYKWYEMQDAVDYYEEFEKPKIIYPNILKQPEFTFDDKGWYTNQKCFIISLADKYLLAILNSKLNHYLFEQTLPKLRGGFYEPSYIFFKDFPIVKPDLKIKEEKVLYDTIVKLSDSMLSLQKQKSGTQVPALLEQVENQITYTDKKINELVYQLYDLTKDEIKIIEEIDLITKTLFK
jgi:adenine-specific DNA-methyltransferase